MQAVTAQGHIGADDAAMVRQWVSEHTEGDLPGIRHLHEAFESVLAKGELDEEGEKALYLAIERVMPPTYRAVAEYHRRQEQERQANQPPPPPDQCLPSLPDGASLGSVIDTETTGLRAESDEILELALILFAFGAKDGEILGTVDEYAGLREPHRRIPHEATLINGINRDMVRGRSLDQDRVKAILARSEILVAHNAAFDRPFVGFLFPEVMSKAWYCSMDGVAWKRKGQPSKGLQQLLAAHQIAPDAAHRALGDARSTLKLLACRNPDGTTYFRDLLRSGGERWTSAQAVPPVRERRPPAREEPLLRDLIDKRLRVRSGASWYGPASQSTARAPQGPQVPCSPPAPVAPPPVPQGRRSTTNPLVLLLWALVMAAMMGLVVLLGAR